MATVRPFKAVRPQEHHASRVAALPYDVMDADEAREMTAGNPISFLHVDKAEIDLKKGIDPHDDRVYAKALANFQELITGNILVQDAAPCFYIYRLTMGNRAQYGLVAMASVDEYLDKTIKKHELTLAAKERDRTKHIDTLDAQTGPIYLAYRGGEEINIIITGWAEGHKPIYDFTAANDVGHTVWVIDDEQVISALRSAFENVPALYIADGHHRNASAVNVALERRMKSGGEACYDKNAEYNYYMSVIFPASQLKILSYNRVIHQLGMTVDEFMAKVSELFDITPCDSAYEPEAKHTFGMYIEKSWYKLTAKAHIIPENDPVGALDVSILQNKLLGPVLNISDPRTSPGISFVGGIRGLGELTRVVDSGAAAAFSMYPTSMDDLMSVADEDKIMPPKSTWFEPKLLSGLFVHMLNN